MDVGFLITLETRETHFLQNFRVDRKPFLWREKEEEEEEEGIIQFSN